MARTSMYAVTDISTREVGIFTQLGSRDKGTLCVQNAFNSTFGRKAVQSIASHQPVIPTYSSYSSLHRAEVKTLFDSFSISYAGPMLSTIFSAKAAKR